MKKKRVLMGTNYPRPTYPEMYNMYVKDGWSLDLLGIEFGNRSKNWANKEINRILEWRSIEKMGGIAVHPAIAKAFERYFKESEVTLDMIIEEDLSLVEWLDCKGIGEACVRWLYATLAEEGIELKVFNPECGYQPSDKIFNLADRIVDEYHQSAD